MLETFLLSYGIQRTGDIFRKRLDHFGGTVGIPRAQFRSKPAKRAKSKDPITRTVCRNKRKESP